MAETDKKDAPKDAATKEATPEKSSQQPPPMWMRALLGFAGLSLLVGFFLPWVRMPAVEGATTPPGFDSGFTLLFSSTGIVGTPAVVVLVIPILGALLSAIAFMGLRYAAQTAVGVAVGIIGYALYVLASMFVQNTSYGLWVVSGGTFVILLLGVTTWMLARRAAETPALAKDAEPAKSK